MNYLTPDETEALLMKVKDLRKGHQLSQFAKAPYLVIADGKFHWIKSSRGLRKMIGQCMFPQMYRVFRNADKGVTINLD